MFVKGCHVFVKFCKDRLTLLDTTAQQSGIEWALPEIDGFP